MTFPILLCSKQLVILTHQKVQLIYFCMDESINEDIGEREVSELDVYEYIILIVTCRLIKIPLLSWSI